MFSGGRVPYQTITQEDDVASVILEGKLLSLPDGVRPVFAGSLFAPCFVRNFFRASCRTVRPDIISAIRLSRSDTCGWSLAIVSFLRGARRHYRDNCEQ